MEGRCIEVVYEEKGGLWGWAAFYFFKPPRGSTVLAFLAAGSVGGLEDRYHGKSLHEDIWNINQTLEKCFKSVLLAIRTHIYVTHLVPELPPFTS